MRDSKGRFVGHGNQNYKDRDWLYQEYVIKNTSISKIAAQCRCHGTTISRYVKKYGFPLRKNTWTKNGMWGKKGKDNPNWNGGVYNKQGYIYLQRPNHPFRQVNGYVAEHRLIMEKYLGRYLTPNEKVHHINGIKDDNRIENLALIDSSNHLKTHYEVKREYYRLKQENQQLKLLLFATVVAKSIDREK